MILKCISKFNIKQNCSWFCYSRFRTENMSPGFTNAKSKTWDASNTGTWANEHPDILIKSFLFVWWGSRAEKSSGCRRGRFKVSSLSEVANDERNWHQRDADANGSKELVDGVGQDKRAGSSCHLGLNHGLTEAQFAQYGCHVDPTAEPRGTETQLEVHKINILMTDFFLFVFDWMLENCLQTT